jgi:CheY-like chemotaxis protein
MEETMRVVGYKTPTMLMRYYAAPRELHSSANPELPALAATRTVRILVVEDNRDAAHMLAQFLRLSGYAVTVAYNSGEGLEAARKAPPDVVLCDIGLPDGDGYVLAQALRENPQTARPPVIIDPPLIIIPPESFIMLLVSPILPMPAMPPTHTNNGASATTRMDTPKAISTVRDF